MQPVFSKCKCVQLGNSWGLIVSSLRHVPLDFLSPTEQDKRSCCFSFTLPPSKILETEATLHVIPSHVTVCLLSSTSISSCSWEGWVWSETLSSITSNKEASSSSSSSEPRVMQEIFEVNYPKKCSFFLHSKSRKSMILNEENLRNAIREKSTS